MNKQFTNNSIRKLPKGWLMVLLSCLTILGANAQNSPGGVGTGLKGWWKANAVSAKDGDDGSATTAWVSSTASAISLPAFGTTPKLYTLDPNHLANFNPSLSMGARNVNGGGFRRAIPILGNKSSFTYIVVYRDKRTQDWAAPVYGALLTGAPMGFGNFGASPAFWLQKDVCAGNGVNMFSWGYGEWCAQGGNSSTHTIYNGGGTGGPYAIPGLPSGFETRLKNQQSQIASMSALGTNDAIDVWVDGFRNTSPVLAVPFYVSSNNGDANFYVTFGADGIYNRFLFGDIQEGIVFDRKLTNAEMTQVNTYLAIKYGITLGQGNGVVGRDRNQLYVASDGTTVYDPAATQGATSATSNYVWNVTGIGRDDASGLDQRQSQSINVNETTGNVSRNPIISSDGKKYYTTNFNNISQGAKTAFATDLTYLIWADDNGSFSEQSTEVPTLYDGSKRLGREWGVTNTKLTSGVSITLDLTDAAIVGASLNRLQLMVDEDGDGDFTTGTQTYYKAASYSAGVVAFNDVIFPAGNSQFTVLTNAVKGGLTLGNCANATVTATAAANAPLISLLANGKSQTAFLNVPITTNMVGPITVSVTGNGITANATNPFSTSLTAGQTVLRIPIKYDGSTPIGERAVTIETPNSGTNITNLVTANCIASIKIIYPPATYQFDCGAATNDVTPTTGTTFTQNTPSTGTLTVGIKDLTVPGTDTLTVSSVAAGYTIDSAAVASSAPSIGTYISNSKVAVSLAAGQTSFTIPVAFEGAVAGAYTVTIASNHRGTTSCNITDSVAVQQGAFSYGNCEASKLNKRLLSNGKVQTATLTVPITTNVAGPIKVNILGDPAFKLNPTTLTEYSTTLTAGQNTLNIPITYDGTGEPTTTDSTARVLTISSSNIGTTSSTIATSTCTAPAMVHLPPAVFTLSCAGALLSPARYTQNTPLTGILRVNLTGATAGTDTVMITSSPAGFEVDPTAQGYITNPKGQGIKITTGQTTLDIPIKWSGASRGVHTLTISDTHGQTCNTSTTVLAEKAVYAFGDCSTATVTPGTSASPLKADGTTQPASMIIPITVTTPGVDTLQLSGTGFTPSSFPVNLTAGQTSITIPLTFDGSNADVAADPTDVTPDGTTPINVSSLIAGNGCDVNAVIEAKSAVVQSMNCTAATQSGSFTANGVAGQIGYIMIPVTVTTAGYMHFTLTGDSRFRMSPTPQAVIAPVGTNTLKVKVIYNGVAPAGSANVTLAAKQISGTTCPIPLTIDNTVGEFTMNCNGTPLIATPTSGKFFNDGTAQAGTIAVPITVSKAGNVTFTLTGSTNMTTSPSPFSTSVTAGQTTVNIPVSYNGAGAADVAQTVTINSGMATSGACTANYTPVVKAGTFRWGNCSNSTVTYPTTLGGFQANSTTQTGSMQIPITGATAGPISVSLSSPGFTTNPNPYIVTLTAGQTVINLPFTYDGTGATGTRSISASSSEATNNTTAPCSPIVNIVSDQGIISFGNCGAATTTGYLVANTTPGQQGTITLPITASKSGPVTFRLTGTNFVSNPLPYTTNVTAGVTTSVTIPFIYDGLGAASIRTLTVTSPTNNGSATCNPNIQVWSSYASYTLNCGSNIISAVANSGRFLAGGGVGQSGSITLPVSVLQNGSTSFNVSGSGFSTNPVPFITNLTVGQTSVTIPVVYDGSGVARTQALTVTQNPGSQSCSNINAVIGGVVYFANPAPATVTTGLTNVSAVTQLAPTGGTQPYVYSAAQQPANGTLVVNSNGTYTYTPRPGFTGTDTYAIQVCDSSIPANCASQVYNTQITATPTPVTPTTSPNPLVAGQAASLVSSGCEPTGTTTWFLNGAAVGTGTPFNTTVPATGGSYTSTCTVNGVPSLPSPSVVVTSGSPDILVSLSVSPAGSIYNIGTPKTITVRFTNIGTGASTAANANIVAPGGFTRSGTIGIVTVPALAAGANTTITFTLQGSTPGASGSVTATLFNGTGGDTNNANNSAVLLATTPN
jgi:hypothetical protein